MENMTRLLCVCNAHILSSCKKENFLPLCTARGEWLIPTKIRTRYNYFEDVCSSEKSKDRAAAAMFPWNAQHLSACARYRVPALRMYAVSDKNRVVSASPRSEYCMHMWISFCIPFTARETQTNPIRHTPAHQSTIGRRTRPSSINGTCM